MALPGYSARARLEMSSASHCPLARRLALLTGAVRPTKDSMRATISAEPLRLDALPPALGRGTSPEGWGEHRTANLAPRVGVRQCLHLLLHAQSRIEARIVMLQWIAMVLVGVGATMPVPLGPGLGLEKAALILAVLILHPLAYTAIAVVGYPWLIRDAPARIAVLTAIDVTIAVGVLFLTAAKPGYTQVLLFCVVLLSATRYSRSRAIGITALVSILQFFSIVASSQASLPFTSLGSAIVAMFALTYGVNLLSEAERSGAAIAAENARLYRAVLLRNRELATINALSQTATQDTDADRLLESGLDLILTSMPLAWGQGFRYDRKQQTMELLFIRRADLGQANEEELRDEALQAARGRLVVATSCLDAAGEPVSRVSAPIMVQGTAAGVLQALVPITHDDPSGAPPTQSLTVVCQELGTWIERALLHDVTQRSLVLEEKNRIARELHDTVLQILFSLGLGLEWCTRRSSEDHDVYGKLLEMRKMTANASNELRSAIYTLSAKVADDGLLPALEKLSATFCQDHQLPISVSAAGTQPALPMLCQNALHRVVRESLMNTYKHARASHVSVRVLFDACRVAVVVQDDGVGLSESALGNYARDPAHFGLRTVARQIADLGGTFEVSNGDESGAVVRAAVPIKGRLEEEESGH